MQQAGHEPRLARRSSTGKARLVEESQATRQSSTRARTNLLSTLRRSASLGALIHNKGDQGCGGPRSKIAMQLRPSKYHGCVEGAGRSMRALELCSREATLTGQSQQSMAHVAAPGGQRGRAPGRRRSMITGWRGAEEQDVAELESGGRRFCGVQAHGLGVRPSYDGGHSISQQNTKDCSYSNVARPLKTYRWAASLRNMPERSIESIEASGPPEGSLSRPGVSDARKLVEHFRQRPGRHCVLNTINARAAASKAVGGGQNRLEVWSSRFGKPN